MKKLVFALFGFVLLYNVPADARTVQRGVTSVHRSVSNGRTTNIRTVNSRSRRTYVNRSYGNRSYRTNYNRGVYYNNGYDNHNYGYRCRTQRFFGVFPFRARRRCY